MKFFSKQVKSNIPWRKREEKDIENVKMLNGAIKNGDVKLIKKMLNADHELVRLITVFGTFLHVACTKGNLDVVKAFVEEGADINKNETLHNCRPLANAAGKGHLDIVRFLHENGAEYDCSQILTSPLIKAINGGHLPVVKYLVEHGVDVSIVYETQSFGKTNAYTYARSYRKEDICQYLKDIYNERGYQLEASEQKP